ncbi:hypothetical protein GCM10011529_09220 [Polymorphobacter glacialis]|uniref:DUF885 domain-containing protein n=1 Tax=Sandarakinorhabdus glacialis TaxID=1614636 RepID=A0A916ZMU2_9SPHN|nr:DUF885 family protein [Polymorphobacter glacialis]GGE05005.1 hypothetical protein GCM10011529_09220 [Polymorphobacter glacialis]
MNRRQLLQTAAATTLLAAPALAATTTEDAKLAALLETFWQEDLDTSPQQATARGLDVGPRAAQRGQLDDESRAGRDAWIASRGKQFARLKAIDATRLSPAARIDHDVVAWRTKAISEGGQRFKFGDSAGGYAPYSPYILSQLTGPYQSTPEFLETSHPVANTADAEAWLSRLTAYGKAIDDSTDAFRTDSAAGVLAPDFILDLAIAQLETQRRESPETTKVTTSLARKAAAAGIAGDWTRRAAAIVSATVHPALDRQLAAVRAARAGAKPDAGAWKLPVGEAFYAGALAFQTTTDLKPDAVHNLGRAQVAELTARLDTLLKAQGMSRGSVGERLNALGARPDQVWPNTDAGRAGLLASLNVQVAEIRKLLPRIFATIPTSPVEVVRVPADIEAGSPGAYASIGSADGARPGRFYINLQNTAERPKFSLPTLTYHEALPGHNWQGAIARDAGALPAVRRYGGNFAAYGEGWALYSEDLAEELGVYQADPLGQIGHLQSLLFRAARLVADTGLHQKRWTRDQATDYFAATTGYLRSRAQREINRYCVWPGQACSYKVGHNEWTRLRRAVEAKQGSNFDIKAFHEVLRMGPMPLTVLAKAIMDRA